jgi:hypothetical protein
VGENNAKEDEEELVKQANAVDAAATFIKDRTTVGRRSKVFDNNFSKSEQRKMIELLDSWEDGDGAQEKTVHSIYIYICVFGSCIRSWFYQLHDHSPAQIFMARCWFQFG